MIPYGYCQCGCGRETKVAPITSRKRDIVKGEPQRFIHNHHTRKPRREVYFGEIECEPVAYVPLQNEMDAIIDTSDLSRVMEFTWTFDTGYVKATVGGIKTKLHRFIIGDSVTHLTDHKNRNPLDNRKSNLRNADYSQNACNRKMRTDNKSGYKGVCLFRGKWRAQIEVNGVNHHLGEFHTPEEAYAAYRSAAPIIHGEFYSV